MKINKFLPWLFFYLWGRSVGVLSRPVLKYLVKTKSADSCDSSIKCYPSILMTKLMVCSVRSTIIGHILGLWMWVSSLEARSNKKLKSWYVTVRHNVVMMIICHFCVENKLLGLSFSDSSQRDPLRRDWRCKKASRWDERLWKSRWTGRFGSKTDEKSCWHLLHILVDMHFYCIFKGALCSFEGDIFIRSRRWLIFHAWTNKLTLNGITITLFFIGRPFLASDCVLGILTSSENSLFTRLWIVLLPH